MGLGEQPAEAAIRLALRNGSCSRLKDGEFPRYAWGAITIGGGMHYFEARVTNRVSGEYKAYPIDKTHEARRLA